MPPPATRLLVVPPLDERAVEQARARQARLTGAPGSLGRLGELGLQLAAITAQPRPKFRAPAVIVVAADHGVAAHDAAARQEITTPQALQVMLNGVAAVNALAAVAGARLLVADLGLASFPVHHRDLHPWKVAAGTRDFTQQPAMSPGEAKMAVERGSQFAQRELQRGLDLVALGSLGPGARLSALALCAGLLGTTTTALVRPATPETQADCALLDAALARLQPDATDPYDVLAKVGGFDLGGLAGIMLAAGIARVPIVLDGVVVAAAAVLALRLAPTLAGRFIAAHRSPELGHDALLGALSCRPLLELGASGGDGGGAATALPLVQAAARLLDAVATREEAGIVTRIGA